MISINLMEFKKEEKEENLHNWNSPYGTCTPHRKTEDKKIWLINHRENTIGKNHPCELLWIHFVHTKQYRNCTFSMNNENENGHWIFLSCLTMLFTIHYIVSLFLYCVSLIDGKFITRNRGWKFNNPFNIC